MVAFLGYTLLTFLVLSAAFWLGWLLLKLVNHPAQLSSAEEVRAMAMLWPVPFLLLSLALTAILRQGLGLG